MPELLSAFEWERPESYFGGVSGIEVSADGRRFVAIGDNGQIMQGDLVRDGGLLVDLKFGWVGGLRTSGGDRVAEDLADSEGLAMAPDGALFVSFERVARVWSYGDWESPASPLPQPAAFARLGENRALEALAILPDGDLIVLPEEPPEGEDRLPLWRYDGSGWTVFDTLPSDGFLPTGADMGPDRHLYILWRRWALPLRFATRVTRHAVLPDGLGASETILETDMGDHDNIEGIAIWREGVDDLRMLLVADDNYSRFQSTEVLEYRIPSALAPAGPDG